MLRGASEVGHRHDRLPTWSRGRAGHGPSRHQSSRNSFKMADRRIQQKSHHARDVDPAKDKTHEWILCMVI